MDDLTREQILTASRPKVTRFEVPALGGAIYLRTLTAGERDRLQASVKDDVIDANARMVAMAWCDAGGASLGYTEADVIQMDGALVGQLASFAVELSSIGATQLENAKKNS